VLRYGTHVLLNLSWAKEDVQAETPVLMETRTSIQTQGDRAPSSKTDSLGNQMLVREIQKLREEVEEYKKAQAK